MPKYTVVQKAHSRLCLSFLYQLIPLGYLLNARNESLALLFQLRVWLYAEYGKKQLDSDMIHFIPSKYILFKSSKRFYSGAFYPLSQLFPFILSVCLFIGVSCPIFYQEKVYRK